MWKQVAPYLKLAALLYNSLYQADGQLFVNQHAYGVPAAHAPVFCFRQSGRGDMVRPYLDSFQRVWASTNRSDSARRDLTRWFSEG